ncbi:MAG: hypothetical protein AAGH89_18890 [Verrucomicrobiota bacterium]
MHHTEIESLDELEARVKSGKALSNCVFQGLDLCDWTEVLVSGSLRQSVFLGCELTDAAIRHALSEQALVFPRLEGVPFRPYRGRLYSPGELLADGYRMGEPESYEETLDKRVYNHFEQHGRDEALSIVETLARRLHDHAITDAMHEFIHGKRVVAIMGGHSIGRDEVEYREVMFLAKELAERGFLVTSGGGPGAMEASHLGASFAGEEDEGRITAALEILAAAPSYKDRLWLDAAVGVWREFFDEGRKTGAESLGIPTRLYGHEPPAIFASHIAKYFANSVREEGLLAIAKHGVVFSPGSAGTIQEIFQDATQNHYVSFGVISPMILFGAEYWQSKKPVYPLLAQLAAGRDYARHLHLHDDRSEIVKTLVEFAGSEYS